MSETPTLEHVAVFDTTLRDGNQTPGISFSVADKIAIAIQLADIGVDTIEAGFPGSEDSDFEAVREVCKAVGDRVVVAAFSRILIPDIEAAGEALDPVLASGHGRIHTGIGTSPLHMGDKLGKTPGKILKETAEGVARARRFTDDVQFYAEDATRSDPEFLMRVLQEAVEHGATAVMIPDTVGVADPDQYARLFDMARAALPDYVVLGAHCHDDLGLATANTLAAVKAGADEIQIAVGGLGERAGNARLETAAINLRLYPEKYGGRNTRIRTEGLTALARDVMARGGVLLAGNAPVTGANGFQHESGIHQDGASKNGLVYEPYPPGLVGQKTSFSDGSQSGKSAPRRRAESLGIKVSQGELKQLSSCLKRLAAEEGRNYVDSDVEQVLAELRGETLKDAVVLEDWTETKSMGKPSVATIQIDGEQHTAESYGGELSALSDAIYKAKGIRAEVRDWRPHADGSTDAVVGIFAEIEDEHGNTVEVYVESPSSAEAQVKAYVKALNMLCRIKS